MMWYYGRAWCGRWCWCYGGILLIEGLGARVRWITPLWLQTLQYYRGSYNTSLHLLSQSYTGTNISLTRSRQGGLECPPRGARRGGEGGRRGGEGEGMPGEELGGDWMTDTRFSYFVTGCTGYYNNIHQSDFHVYKMMMRFFWPL